MLLAIGGLGACNERNPPAATLDVAQPEELTEEQEWLQDLQMMRVILEGQDEPVEMTADAFEGQVERVCEDAMQLDVGTDSCSYFLATGPTQYICIAKTLLAAANTQSTPLTIRFTGTNPDPAISVPEQSEETNYALASTAVVWARNAMFKALAQLATPTSCSGVSWSMSLGGGHTYASAFTSAYAEAFYVAQDAYNREIEASLNVSDKMRSTSVDPNKALARSVVGEQLSRAAAAHLIVAGDPGLYADTTTPLCNTEPLTPQGKTALKLLRDAGVSPDDVLDPEVATEDELLNGSLSRGSVRQRLGQFYNYSEFNPNGSVGIQSVESYYKIDLQSFEAARQHLAQEITAFARSRTAQLPRAPGVTTGWRRYAGTATEPSELPGIAWSVRMGSTQSTAPGNWDQVASQPDQGLRQLIGRGVVEARRVLSTAGSFPSTVQQTGFAPLALIAAAPEHRGYAQMITSLEVGIVAYAYGYGIDDRVRVVAGEDGLRCAVEGSIEGAPCTNAASAAEASYPCEANEDPNLSCLTLDILSNFETSAISSAFGDGFVQGGAAFLGLDEETTYYLVKPKLAGSEQPGQFEALAGGRGFGETIVPIVTGLDKRVSDLMAPSREHCAKQEVSCAGVTLDARLPLENELTSDENGVENSWQHYLALARQAADEADLLGQEYLNAKLETTLDDIQTETRQEEQLQRAEEKLQQVQTACGTAIESRKLLSIISGGNLNSPQEDLANALSNPSVACEVDSDCNATSSLMDQAYRCVAGTCIVDLWNLAEWYSGTDAPELKRLADCLDERPEATADWVTLGDKPLCVYEAASNSNLVCPDGTAPCPRPVPSDGVCPAIANTVPKQAKELQYFRYTAPPPVTEEDDYNPCDDFRTLRDIVNLDSENASKWRYDVHKRLAESNILHPAKLFADDGWLQHSPLGWRGSYGGFATVMLDEAPLYSTGSVEREPGPSGWPCVAEPREGCEDGSSSLFCEAVDCSDPYDRAAINQRLLAAVVATHVIGNGWGMDRRGGNLSLDAWVPVLSMHETCDVPDHHIYHYATNAPIAVCNSAGSAFLPKSSISPTADGWFVGDSVYSAVDGIKFSGFRHYSSEGSSGVPIVGFKLTGENAAHSSQEAFLSGLYDLDGNPPTDGSYMYNYLKKRTSEWLPATMEYRFDPENTHPNQLIILGGELWVEHMLDGVELLCEVAAQRQGLSAGNAAEINSLADLERVAGRLESLGVEIENSAANMIFARVPHQAFDAMREASATGAFPSLGGQMAQEVSALRSAMIRTGDAVPVIGGTITQIGAAVRSLRAALELVDVTKEIADYQLISTIRNQLAACASTVGVTSLYSLQTVATCVNAAVQIGVATQVKELEGDAADLEGELAKAQAQDRMAQLSVTLQLAALDLKEALEQIDASLAGIENLRKQAKVNLVQAIYQASWQAERQAEVTRFLGTLASGKQTRYRRALHNAKLMAFMAKRAIEQRLGVSLSEMRDPMALGSNGSWLVEENAPSEWEADVCTLSGLNYGLIQGGGSVGLHNVENGFIGDYVSKLEYLIENYRLENSFHEGRDVAILSLRDDVFNVRRTCDVEGKNLLLQAGQLNNPDHWSRIGCNDDPELGGTNCIAAVPSYATPVTLLDPGLSAAQAYQLRLGDGAGCPSSQPAGPCSWQPGAAIVQQVRLGAGRYRLSWYSQNAQNEGGASSAIVQISSEDGEVELDSFDATDFFPAQQALEWNRMAVEFSVEADGDYLIGFGSDATTIPTTFITVAAPMLENLPATGESFELTSFQNTGDTTLVSAGVCEDTDGAIFRTTKWKRDCVRACDAGLSNNCTDGPLYCYREASFGVAQSWIENGELFNYSGFARGNFNYRIEDLALNFVGTGIRDCGDETLPSACYAAGYVPYSLEHSGPFFVRNHYGDDYRAHLFDGKIEHARGLATERYLTNPLASADRELLADYMRGEFQGRPLDGNFTIRVWEEPGADFDAIEDVQLVLNYRYWTRLE